MKDITQFGALSERQTVKKFKDFEMTTDTATGKIEIIKIKPNAPGSDNFGNGLTEEVYMSRTPGEQILDKNGKYIKSLDEYEEGTAYIRNDGPNTGDVYEEVSGVTDDIFKEVGEKIPEVIRKGQADGGRTGYNKGKVVKQGIEKLIKAGEGKFTKAQYLIERIKNTIKGSPDDKYVQETFPGFIKELEANPDLAKNENVFKQLSGPLPENQQIVVYGDDTLDFFTTSSGPKNIKKLDQFMAKHDLSRDKALEIMKMEPNDQVMELTKTKFMKQKRTDNSTGGFIGYADGGPITSSGLNYLMGEDDNVPGQLVSNTDDGSRPGYSGKDRRIPLDKKNLDKANLKRVDDSVNELYTKYGKEYVDNAAKEWAKKSNLEKNRIKKITNTDLPLNEMQDQVDRSNFKVKFKDDIEKYGEWNPDRKSIQNKKLYPASSTSNKMSFRSRIFDALGRKDSPNYDLPKLKAMQKNFAEYDVLKKYLNKNFGIVTALDHPLDKATIETIMNASSKDLINVNILEQNLNTSFKKTLNNKYRQAMLDGNLDQKRAVETIAKKFNLNIGSVPDNQFKAKQVGPFELNKIDKGVGSFDKLNIKKEMLKSLENASKLDTEWGNYIKDNSDVFKTAGINTNKLKKPKNVENITKNLPEIKKYLNATVAKGGSKGKAAAQALAIIIGTTGGAMAGDDSEGLSGTETAAIGGGAAATLATKTGRKVLSNLLSVAGVPASIAFNSIYGIDPESSFDRTILGAEAALAPMVVKDAIRVTDKIKNPLLKKGAELLTTGVPKYALKAARYASPIGIASLAGEAVYNVGKLGYEDQKRFNALSPEEQMFERAERRQFANSIEGS